MRRQRYGLLSQGVISQDERAHRFYHWHGSRENTGIVSSPRR
jgi:hypothetical protein